MGVVLRKYDDDEEEEVVVVVVILIPRWAYTGAKGFFVGVAPPGRK